MRTILHVSAIVLALGLLSATGVSGQRARGGGWGAGSAYGKMYNPTTVETIRGEVVKVEKITPMKGMGHGVHLLVKTDKEEISVHLGPAWYIDNQEIKIEPKDQVEVTGSRVTFEDKPAIIAAEVKKGDQTLKLRDKSGRPLWAGWRRTGSGTPKP